MAEKFALDWSAVIALLLALVHISAPRVRPLLARRADTLGVMGGGMAVGYVFIHLFNEIDTAHELLGYRIHLVMLAGFFAYFWVERRSMMNVYPEPEEEDSRAQLDVRLAFGWLYGWLLLYTLPEALKLDGLLLLPPMLAICVHMVYEDYHEAGERTINFDARDRFILATGPLAGWLTDLFFFDDQVWLSDSLTAFLAGSILYKVFSREIPRDREFNMGWFLAGVIVFVILDGIGRQ